MRQIFTHATEDIPLRREFVYCVRSDGRTHAETITSITIKTLTTMSNADVITEKVYCSGYPQSGGCDNAAAAMMLNNQNQWMNNPFAYMMMMGIMRWMYGDDWNRRNGGSETEINSRFNQLSNQMSDNHNTDIINEAVKGNTARIGELANNLNVDLRAIQTGICDIRSGIQQVSGDVKVQGYQNQLAQKDMQYQLAQGHNFINNNLQQGFATLGFSTERGVDRINSALVQGFASSAFTNQQNKCEIVDAINASQQRTADLLNAHWKDELSLQLQDEKFKNSQLQQNIYMRDLIEKGNGCGCGCN